VVCVSCCNHHKREGPKTESTAAAAYPKETHPLAGCARALVGGLLFLGGRGLRRQVGPIKHTQLIIKRINATKAFHVQHKVRVWSHRRDAPPGAPFAQDRRLSAIPRHTLKRVQTRYLRTPAGFGRKERAAGASYQRAALACAAAAASGSRTLAAFPLKTMRVDCSTSPQA
jgi:hypothetical protein